MPEKDFFEEVLTRLPEATRDAIAVRMAEMMDEEAVTSREREHEFTLVLTGIVDLDDEVMDALFEAGCSDATPALRSRVVSLTFSRAAASLEEAILGATRDIRAAGIGADVLRVEFNPRARP
jgi:hypothetical protein